MTMEMLRALPPNKPSTGYLAYFTQSAQAYLEELNLTPDYFSLKKPAQTLRQGDLVVFRLGSSTFEGTIENVTHHDIGGYLAIELGRLNKL